MNDIQEDILRKKAKDLLICYKIGKGSARDIKQRLEIIADCAAGLIDFGQAMRRLGHTKNVTPAFEGYTMF